MHARVQDSLVYCRAEWDNSSDVPSRQALINSAYKKLGNMRAMPNGENLMASGARAHYPDVPLPVFFISQVDSTEIDAVPRPQLDLRSITVNL